ncbi:peptide chain release factor 2 [Candidatus Parcubacteria bacterium]|nr:MAG: peptide chain release factor 2 [Candidatus Parcubacteria bacterium]
MENLLKQIENLRERLLGVWKLLNIERRQSELHQLKIRMSQPNFWDNQAEAVRLSRRAEELDKEVREWQELRRQIRELEELVALAQKEKDTSIDAEAHRQYQLLKERFAKMEFLVLFSGEYDEYNAILSIHAGTGGVDAQDWAAILERMYLRFAERRGWQANLIHRLLGNEAGIKNSVLHIQGRWAFGYLQSENGVHRLVRISPFDAEAMRHTSFALVEVIPELPEAEGIKIKEGDLRIDVFRSSGPGGQSVNTTDSAVRVVHKPTGIMVTCQAERSQHQNKERALQILKAKLFQLEQEKRRARQEEIKGAVHKAEWGKQIRSYVMQPYKMVKDHRTNYETSQVEAVLDGQLEPFMESYLRWRQGQKNV